MQIAGSALVGALDGYADFGSAFADGSTTGVGTVNATVVTNSSMTGNLTFTSAGNTSYQESWSLDYQSLSTTGSSLSAISGSYTDISSVQDSNTGSTITIGITGQAPVRLQPAAVSWMAALAWVIHPQIFTRFPILNPIAPDNGRF